MNPSLRKPAWRRAGGGRHAPRPVAMRIVMLPLQTLMALGLLAMLIFAVYFGLARGLFDFCLRPVRTAARG